MVMCPQVLQAGASLCMLLAAAFTASIPPSCLGEVFLDGVLEEDEPAFGVIPEMRMLLSSGDFFSGWAVWVVTSSH